MGKRIGFAIKLVNKRYSLTDIFDIQNKIEEVYNIDVHYYSIQSNKAYRDILEEQQRIKFKTLTHS